MTARFRPLNFYLLLSTEHSFLEVDSQHRLEVCASRGGPRSSSGADAAPEKCIEDISEAAEMLEPLEPACAAVACDAPVAETIIPLSLLGIYKDLVRFGDFLEPFLGAGSLVAVGVILEGELAESLPYLLIRRVAGDAQDIVVVSFTRSH